MIPRAIRWRMPCEPSVTLRAVLGLLLLLCAAHPTANASQALPRQRADLTPPDPPIWTSLGPTNLAGRMLCIAFDQIDPRVIVVGAAGGGVWRSYELGLDWVPRGDRLPSLAIGAIARSARNPSILVVGTGDPSVVANSINGVGIWRSSNNGVTWQPTNVVHDRFEPLSGYHAIVANEATGVFLAGGTHGLYRSGDDGLTWSAVAADGNWTDVAWRPESADSAYAVREYDGVYVSADSGHTFARVSTGLPPGNAIGGFARIAPSASDSRIVYASFSAADSFAFLGLYRSMDAGATWELRSNEPDLLSRLGYFEHVLAVDPADPNRLVAGGNFLWRSTDGGTTWNFFDTTASGEFLSGFHALRYHPYYGTLWAATETGVAFYEDGVWRTLNEGLVTSEFYSVCLTSEGTSLAYGGTHENGFLRFVGNPSWDQPMLRYPSMECHCDPIDPARVYGVIAWGLHLASSDSLSRFTFLNDGIHGTARYVAPSALDPTNANRLFTATDAGIFRTLNGGVLWERVGPGADVVSISISPLAPNWVWALERSTGEVRVSRDGGTTWSVRQAAPFAGIGGTKILAHPSDTLAAFCTFLHHPSRPPLVLLTSDGGETWADVSGDLGDHSVNTIAIDPTRLLSWYIGTETGVWHSRNGGARWTRYGDQLPNAEVFDLEVQPATGTIWAATHGRGMWLGRLDSEGDRVTSQGWPVLLELASANPARTSVLFRFAAQGGQQSQLRVYDVRGRLVADVAAAPADGRARTATWNTARVSKGIYFATLRSGSNSISRKVVIVR